jgi:hypothetical protein
MALPQASLETWKDSEERARVPKFQPIHSLPTHWQRPFHLNSRVLEPCLSTIAQTSKVGQLTMTVLC